jgi:uncharacterized protein (DUF433 family)
MSDTSTERIVSKPGVSGGKPCIAGTRIRVQEIYNWHELQGQSADKYSSPLGQKREGKDGANDSLPS